MRKTSVYRLTPPEMTVLKEYITDGLKRGTLQRSEAPDACSFFFIDKKDGKLRPVQDYRPLNAITRKNAAPIPLIPELIDKLLGAQFFTKLDVRWGYNNICILLRSKTLMVRRARICTGASSACTRGCPFERTWFKIEVLTDDNILMRDDKGSLLVILETTQR